MLDKTVVSGELWFLTDTFFSFFRLVEPGDPGLLNKLLSQVHLNPAPQQSTNMQPQAVSQVRSSPGLLLLSLTWGLGSAPVFSPRGQPMHLRLQEGRTNPSQTKLELISPGIGGGLYSNR